MKRYAPTMHIHLTIMHTNASFKFISIQSLASWVRVKCTKVAFACVKATFLALWVTWTKIICTSIS